MLDSVKVFVEGVLGVFLGMSVLYGAMRLLAVLVRRVRPEGGK